MYIWVLCLLFAGDAASFDHALRAGLEALQGNNLTVARAQLEDASRMQPGNARVWLGLAQTYWKLGLADLAYSSADKAQAADPESPVVLHGLAYFYTEGGDPAKAAGFEASYAEKAPRDREAFPRAIDLYLQAKQPRSAIELARKALAQADRADVHELLGEAYDQTGDTEKAVAEMQRAIGINRYEESFYFGLGRLYLRHDNPAAAVQTFEDGRKVFAKSAQLELALGVAYYGLRRFGEAADCFLRTIQIAPGVEQPYVFLSRMLDQAEDKLPQVTSAYATFVKARPDNYLAYFVYAKALSMQPGDPHEAEGLLRKSIALNGKFWESHYQLGLLLERSRDFEGAAGAYRRAIELNGGAPAPHYHLARVYERLGKKDEAAAEYAAHERLSSAEAATIRRQENAVSYRDLTGK